MFIKDQSNVSDPAVRTAYGKLCGAVGIACNFFLFLIKLTAGLLCGSVAVTADAVNNLSDASSSVISLLGFKLAAKPADDDHPYGHGRYEYLSALAVAILVVVIGFETLGSGIQKIVEPTEVEFGALTVAVLLVSVMVKLWLMVFNSSIGKKIGSAALIATAKDSRNDIVSSLAVLVSAIISYASGVELDGYMGVIVAAFILYSAFGLISEAISPMLGNPPDAELVREIEEYISTYPKVIGIHDLIIHDYGPGRRFASVHVEMPAEEPVLEAHDIIDNIERDLSARFNMQTSIHYDPVVTSDPHLHELKEFISEYAGTLGDGVTVHDLRIVPGQTHTNVIFDCVLPRSSAIGESELKKAISDAVAKKYTDHFCVITVDRSFVSNS